MMTILTIDEAAKKVYGPTIQPVKSPAYQWQIFTPFIIGPAKKTLFLSLLEVPAHFYTSEEIQRRAIQRWKGLLHQIKIVLVERSFQSSFYLLASQTNMMSLKSMHGIKTQASQKIEIQIIYSYLKFTKSFQQIQVNNHSPLSLNEIGIVSKEKLTYVNFFMYFQSYSQTNLSTDEKARVDVDQEIKSNLLDLFGIDGSLGYSNQFYQIVAKKYGNEMVKVIQKWTENTEISSLLSLMSTEIDESFNGTVTDTNIEEYEKISDSFMNDVTNNTAAFILTRSKKQKKKLSLTKIGLFAFIFILILCGIGTITFRYLVPRQLTCQQDQYIDQSSMKCLNCNTGCEKCSGGESNMCESCKGTLYLILRQLTDKQGQCGETCKGMIVRTNICIIKG